MINLLEKYQLAKQKNDDRNFTNQIQQNSQETFFSCCKQIGINSTMTFFDGVNSVYQLRIIKDNISGISLIKDIIQLKTLKSLISNSVNYEKFISYITKYKTIKNPILNNFYGFYYRKSGRILPIEKNGFNQDKISLNKLTGEIKIYQKLPDVKNDSILEYLVKAVTPDFKDFLDWLSVYVFEHRKGLKKAHLGLYGDYPYPLVNLIESIYPNGFYYYDTNSLPKLLKYNNWSAKCCYYTTQKIKNNYTTMCKFLDLMANENNSETYLVFCINKSRYLKSSNSKCINIKLYSKEVIENNLANYGLSNFLEEINNQIGKFCLLLHERYKLITQDQINLSNPYGIEITLNDDDLSTDQIYGFTKHYLKCSLESDNKIIERHYKHYLKTNVVSIFLIDLFCVKYKINTDKYIENAKKIGLFSKISLTSNIDNMQYKAYKIIKKWL